MRINMARRAVAVVTGEKFISAVAGEGDGGDVADGFGEMISRKDGGIGEGLPDGFFDEQLEGGDHVLVHVDFEAGVAAVDFFCDGLGVGGFVVGGFGKSHGDRLNRIGRPAAGVSDGALHKSCDDGGVDATGEKAGDGHVSHHLRLNGASEDDARFRLAAAGDGERVEFSGPVDAAIDDIFLETEPTAGKYLADVAPDGLRRGEIAEQEVEPDLFLRNAARDFGPCEDAGDGAAEHDAIFERRVKERLLAHSVACEEKGVGVVACVPNSEGEHAEKFFGKFNSPLLPAVEEDFGVGVIAAEGVAGGLEFFAEEGVIVDFAVEDHVDIAGFIGHGLGAAQEIVRLRDGGG